MEEPQSKRMRVAAVAKKSNSIPSKLTIHSLPEEILVSVFLRLDEVSRQEAEVAFPRWEKIMSKSRALDKVVKIDLNNLVDGQIRSKLFGSQLARTVLYKNTAVRTLIITDESNPAKPWQQRVTAKNDRCYLKGFMMDMVYTFANYSHYPHGMHLKEIVLHKLVLRWSDLYGYFKQLSNEDDMQMNSLRGVEFVGVSVRGIGIEYEWSEDKRPFLVRNVTGRVDCTVGEGQPLINFATLVGKNDPPLTAVEKKVFKDTLADLEIYDEVARRKILPIIVDMAGSAGAITAEKLMYLKYSQKEYDEFVGGSPAPLVARLVIASQKNVKELLVADEKYNTYHEGDEYL